MIDAHTAATRRRPSILQADAHPLCQLDVDRVRAKVHRGLSQRRRGHDDPQRAHQPRSSQFSDARALGVAVHRHRGLIQRLQMVACPWLAGQLDRGEVDRVVDEARHTASLVAKYRLKVRGETSAIAAI